MLSQKTRTAILELSRAGHGTRAIARALGVSRTSVKRVLTSRVAEPPPLSRESKVEPHRAELVALLAACRGNLVRVHEELEAMGVRMSYAALTAYCRRHGIGHDPPQPVGRYEFEPGQEMQHDTSPHDARIDGRVRRGQTASLVFFYSRMLFFQHYPRFDRFFCKLFLTDALRYLGGVCARCMIDNTHVIVASGTGANMIPAPEMAAFAERFGFVFVAHEKGDANRSARVERPFHYIENNFLAGREFDSYKELNAQAMAWCDKVNAKHKRHLHASPRELFAAEQPRLGPLPLWIPEPYALHHRIVDSEGYVNLRGVRYSAPWRLIGRRIEAHETRDHVEIYAGPRLVATHERTLERPVGGRLRVTDPAHRPPRSERRGAKYDVSPQERRLLTLAPELADYVARLKQQARRRGPQDVRRLLRMVTEYPRAPLVDAVRRADHYGLFDLERVERMLLRSLTTEFFLVAPEPLGDGDDNGEDAGDARDGAVHEPAGERPDDDNDDVGAADAPDAAAAPPRDPNPSAAVVAEREEPSPTAEESDDR